MPGHPKTWNGTATLSGRGALFATGSVIATHNGSAALSGKGTLTASGTKFSIHNGSATLSGSGTLRASGTRTRFGTATLAGTGTLAATGSATAGGSTWSGTATLVGSGTLRSTGVRIVYGTAALAGAGKLSAIGVASSSTTVKPFLLMHHTRLSRLGNIEQWLTENTGYVPHDGSLREMERWLLDNPIAGKVCTPYYEAGTDEFWAIEEYLLDISGSGG